PSRRTPRTAQRPMRPRHLRHRQHRLPAHATKRGSDLRETPGRDSFRKVSILPGHRIGNRFVQRSYAVPFAGGPDAAIAADLIDAPVNFQRMIIRVTKLHGDLATGTPPAFEVDLRAMRAQPVARVDDLCQGRDLESEMVQFAVRVLSIAGADQRQTVMI